MKLWLLLLIGLVGCGLLASGQCYTDCSLSTAAASQGAMAHCPEHSHSSSQPRSACPYHHFHLIGPQTGLQFAAASTATFVPEAADVPSFSSVPARERVKPAPSPPPVSVLRI